MGQSNVQGTLVNTLETFGILRLSLWRQELWHTDASIKGSLASRDPFPKAKILTYPAEREPKLSESLSADAHWLASTMDSGSVIDSVDSPLSSGPGVRKLIVAEAARALAQVPAWMSTETGASGHQPKAATIRLAGAPTELCLPLRLVLCAHRLPYDELISSPRFTNTGVTRHENALCPKPSRCGRRGLQAR